MNDRIRYQGLKDGGKFGTLELRVDLSDLPTDYGPRCPTGVNDIRLPPKTVRNAWITLSALFHWVRDEFQIHNPMKRVPSPQVQDKVAISTASRGKVV